ncbi:MAG TPA: hypothetical protein VK615_17070 [Candidatus Binatia bacterium]|nr:hypothetical protein [Candidatus Binatia bacterium]
MKSLVLIVSLCICGAVAFGAEADKKEKRSKQIEKYDTNKDGKLDKSERQAMRKDRESDLKKYDKDGDGKLDKSERKAARADQRKSDENTKPVEKSGDQPKTDK